MALFINGKRITGLYKAGKEIEFIAKDGVMIYFTDNVFIFPFSNESLTENLIRFK